MGTLTQLENVTMLKTDVKLIHLESTTAVIVLKLYAVVGNGATITLFIA